MWQLHLYAWYKKIYWLIFKNLFRLGVLIGLIVLLYIILNAYVIDFEATFIKISEKIPKFYVFTLFFVSESLLGLIPPDLFIAWTSKLEYPWLCLTILSLLSYAGGIVAYRIGYAFRNKKWIKNITEVKFKKSFDSVKKWGALFILIAALLPLPYSPVSLIAGSIKYPFKRYVIFGLARIIRFFIYALPIFKLL